MLPNTTTPAIDHNYDFNVGHETIPQYNERIRVYNENKNRPSTTAAPVNTSSPTTTPPVHYSLNAAGNAYVADSSAIVADENNTMNNLSSLFGQTPDIQNFMQQSQSSVDEILKYQKELEERQKKEEERINADYERERATQERSQASETGSTNTALTTRLGGYLGSSGSATGVMNNLAASHRTEMLALSAKRDQAIQAARNAISDKQFALAKMKADEIKATTESIYQRQQDFFNNALKLQAEGRASRADQRAEEDQRVSQIKDFLDGIGTIAESGLDVEVDPSKAAETDSYYGVPGFTAAYADAKNSAAQAKSQEAKLDSMKKYVDLIQSVPAGMKIPIGDETVTGIGKVADISSYQIEDQWGNVRIVNFNKGNGQYSVTNVGRIGKPAADKGVSDDTKSTAVSSVMMMMQNGVDKTGKPVMDSKGQISASAYLDAVKRAEKQYPGTANYIHSKFLDPSLGDSRYFSKTDLAYLRQKAGIGVGYGATTSDDKPKPPTTFKVGM